MVSTRLLGVLSTALLVVGALSIGQALHLSVVTGRASPTSLPVVVYGVVGVVTIALGYRARKPVAEEYALTSDARERGERERRERERRASAGPEGSSGIGAGPDSGAGGDGTSFDPAMSPLGDAEPGTAERSRRAAEDDREDVDGGAAADERGSRDGAGRQ